MALSNGNKISVSVISAAVVTSVVGGVALATNNPAIAASSVTGFFAFLGGLLMGKVLA